MAMLNSQMGHRELYFITVSFPPVVTDALGMQLLNTWLTSLRKYRMIRQYIWVAERQQVGTIHFHICVPHFLNIHRANRMMAGCLKELHKKGSIHYPAFAKYNGVDIAGTRPGGKGSKKQVTNFAGKQKAKALGWYLTKYITKNATEFDQLAWHNSRGYSALHHGITLTDAEFEDVLQYHLQLNEFKIFERDFFCWAPWARGKPPDAIQLELFKVNSYTQWLLGYCHPKDDGVLTYTEPVTSTVRNPSTEIPNNTKKINDMRFGDSKNKDMRLFPLCIGRECVLVRRSRVAAFIEQVQKYDQLCAVLYYDVSINASLYSIIDLTGQGCLPTMEYWECSVRAVEGVLPWPLYFSDIFFIGEKPLPWESEASADQRIRNYKTTNKMITDLQLSLFNKFSSAQQYSYTPEYLDYCIAKFIALPLPGGLYTDRFKVSHAAHLAEIKKEIAGNNFELAMQRMAYAVAWYLQLPNL